LEKRLFEMAKGSLMNKKAGAAGLIRKERQERYHKPAEISLLIFPVRKISL